MMNTILLRTVGAGLSFLFILLSGFWLTRSGKPYGVLIFTIHKLFSVGMVVLLVITVRRANQAMKLGPTAWLAVIVTGLCFLTTVVAGSLLSISDTMPVIVYKAHQVTPYLTTVATLVTLYTLLKR
jgi:TctA family transporter